MPSLKSWFPLLRIPAVLVVIALFFALYNRFLLDTNLQNLRTSLSLLDAATGVGQAEAALLLVDQALVDQMAQEGLNLPALASLEHAHGSLSSDERLRSVEDVQAMVAILAEDQAAARPTLLAAMDGVITRVRSTLDRTALLPRQVLSEPTFPEMDEARLQEAIRLERRGQLAEAAGLYEQLLLEYPRYVQRVGLKLRLAQIHQKTHALDRAEQSAREALQLASSFTEVRAAQQLLAQLAQAKALQAEARSLEVRFSTLNPGPERQRAGFELGSLLIKSYDMEEAAKVFQASAKTDPEGEWTVSCLFKEAWCLKYLGRLDEAAARFREIIKRFPQDRWAAISYQQIAEIYKATGDHAAAVETYQLAAQESPDAALSAIFTTQAGSTLLLDMKDEKKAQQFFETIAEKYPASSMGAVTRTLSVSAPAGPAERIPTPATDTPATETSPAEGTLPALAAGTPVMNWLTGFLPIFVDVFIERLTKYMQAVGEKELTRRYSEQEFQDLVLRRVQQRFPGQLSRVVMKIRPDGFVGSGDVKLGMLRFPLSARIGITILDEKPYAKMHEVKVGPLALPENLLKTLEERTNQTIERKKYPLKIKRYELREGSALISVEMAE